MSWAPPGRGAGIRAFVLTDHNETGAYRDLNSEGLLHNEVYAVRRGRLPDPSAL